MFVLLMAVWLLLNAHFALDVGFLQILLFGVAVCGVLTVFAFRFTRWDMRFERFFWRNLPRLCAFGVLLVGDILASNVGVIRVLCSKKKPEPVIVSFNIPIRNEMLRAALANAITLTPGTITVFCNETHYVVHCLKRDFIDGFEDGHLVRLAKKMDESYAALAGKEKTK